MMGSRPLTEQEIEIILNFMDNSRNKALFILGLKTGYRISELLSLKVSDVVQYNKIKNEITVCRKSMKGKQNSRTIVLHDEAKKALVEMGAVNMKSDSKLFSISRIQAHRIIKKMIEKAKIEGKISTHSMRKTFAKKMYHALGKDLINTQKALGHKSVQSTVSYLSFEQSEIDNAIKNI